MNQHKKDYAREGKIKDQLIVQLHTNMSEKKIISSRSVSYILLLLGLAEAIYLRSIFIDRSSADYECCVREWYNHIKDAGFFKAFRDNFSDYTPPYLHLIAFSTLLPFKPVYAVKTIGFVFEFLTACFIYKIIIFKHKDNINALWASLTFLLCPTVILNNSWWSQCDIVYTTFLVLSLYNLLQNKFFNGYLFFAISFAFKLQTVFALPVFIFLAFYDFRNLKYMLLIPLVYILAILPSAIAGRNFIELLNIYNGQSGQSNYLWIGLPTFYAIISPPPEQVEFWSKFGRVISISSLILIPVAARLKISKKPLTPDFIFKLFLASVMFIPFITPFMHERYFFTADVLSIVYVFYFRRYYFVPLIIITGSLIGYLNYLVGYYYLLTQSQLALPVLVVVLFLLYDFFSDRSYAGKAYD